MLHSSASVKVSRDEAERIDRESTDRLLEDRKLALIVDLDQTIIHATVDPVFGDWARDRSSANWEALSDVFAFQLGVDGVTVTSEPQGIDPEDTQSFATGGEEGGCWYFVKKRPGLDKFLETLKTRFELHVYTMGARSYAECICKIVDPTATLFGSRILTRDENDSQMHKSLARLFPVNTSMVAIIDDRADVWDWSPNLIKVQPFNFFIGIGDINSFHLGPDSPIVPVPEDSAAASVQAEAEAAAENVIHGPEKTDDASDARKDSATVDESPSDDPPARAETTIKASPCELALCTGDKELELIQDVLTTMHTRWYAAHDRKTKPDVEHVLGNIKHGVLDGCELAFSGLIPLGEQPESSAIWRHAEEFGAKCHRGITRHVTHVVAANPGTAKTEEAHHLGIKVVWPTWLNDSICRWARQPEGPYIIPREQRPPPGAPGASAGADSGAAGDDTGAGAGSGDAAADSLGLASSASVPDAALGDPHALDALATMDWGEAEDEVDAFLDDDDDESEVRSSVDDLSREPTPSLRDDSPSPAPKRRRLGGPSAQSKLRFSTIYGEEEASPSSDDHFLEDLADEMEHELEGDDD
ncbi:protein-serine/threonine phosphatase [Malassezia cuniculi]|uniref:RNA polymerase II subunit A C-terminal domain phosphatase n=1 Tax=Malassezia cuniculi TaxID=948313 RepID=A0AAF0J798_9BASI|nr:protein-serine/threonine phosphatase [Malassezia cuniculi]